jgi:hypothetical protein
VSRQPKNQVTNPGTGNLKATTGRRKYIHTFFELYVWGTKIHEHQNVNQWSDYKNITYIHELYKGMLGCQYQIYKRIRSKFPEDENPG